MAFNNSHIITTLTEHAVCCGDKQQAGTVKRTAAVQGSSRSLVYV